MPMKTDGGRDFTLVRNEANGLFDLTFDETNNFACDDTEIHTVLSLLGEFQGEWWADETGKRGSRLHKIKLDLGSTKGDLESAVVDALERAKLRITDVSAVATRLGAGRYRVDVQWRNRHGHLQNVRLPFAR